MSGSSDACAEMEPSAAGSNLSCMLLVVSCEWWPWRLAPGTWADWLTAVAAIGALIAASVAARQAWKQNENTLKILNVERRRDRRAQMAERRRTHTESRAHQADQVASWAGESKFPNFGRLIAAEITNHSLLPVYRVRATFSVPDGSKFVAPQVDVLKPGKPHFVRIPDELLKLTTAAGHPALAPGTLYRYEDLKEGIGVAIEFMDTKGSCWQRNELGQLTSIEGPYDQGD
jgi:hypothetical protein